jgi:hypothetical protein
MKQVKYTKKPNKRIQMLAKGIYHNIPYYVTMIHGDHPCAYIEIPEYYIFEDTYDIKCHGGITYASRRLKISDNKCIISRNGTFLGWDYCHLGDYSVMTNGSKKYTVEEIVKDVEVAIDSYIAIKKGK